MHQRLVGDAAGRIGSRDARDDVVEDALSFGGFSNLHELEPQVVTLDDGA